MKKVIITTTVIILSSCSLLAQSANPRMITTILESVIHASEIAVHRKSSLQSASITKDDLDELRLIEYEVGVETMADGVDCLNRVAQEFRAATKVYDAEGCTEIIDALSGANGKIAAINKFTEGLRFQANPECFYEFCSNYKDPIQMVQ